MNANFWTYFWVLLAGGLFSTMAVIPYSLAINPEAVDLAKPNGEAFDRICSDKNGFYLFKQLPLDTYTLSAGQFGTEGCGLNMYTTVVLPSVSLTTASPIHEGQNFTLLAQ